MVNDPKEVVRARHARDHGSSRSRHTAPPTSLQSTTESSGTASMVFGCCHMAGGLIEAGLLLFGGAAVGHLGRVSRRQPR